MKVVQFFFALLVSALALPDSLLLLDPNAVCSISSARVACPGQTPRNFPGPITTAASSGARACVLLETSEVWCWTGHSEPVRLLAAMLSAGATPQPLPKFCSAEKPGSWPRQPPASVLLLLMPLLLLVGLTALARFASTSEATPPC
eukprot:TRINITY_DN2292_c1_g1_i10.p2 TRINITY_DN2292_c1_g1~~TRINITY_DN2292_c1_g1_i10.p2  ORF type:complete len:146 (+),score=18.44 TRINITY_DN2292_c1_g1_i10:336-773(+)